MIRKTQPFRASRTFRASLAPLLSTIAATAAVLALSGPGAASAQGEAPEANDATMMEMMKQAERYTKPGQHHAFLQRFVGDWTTEFRITMTGMETPVETGSATFDWLMEGRWIRQQSTGSMMGMPMQTHSILGYDNFKQSYVASTVWTIDTAMHYAEGDLDPATNALLLYGTLDEYLTGEHDKMVKTVWRFPSQDRMVMEVHDLPIGENNTQVVEVVYTRKK